MVLIKKVISVVLAVFFSCILVEGQKLDTLFLYENLHTKHLPSTSISRLPEKFRAISIDEAIKADKDGLFEKGDTIPDRTKMLWFKVLIKNDATTVQDWQLGIYPFEAYKIYIVKDSSISLIENGSDVPKSRRADPFNYSHIFFQQASKSTIELFVALLPKSVANSQDKNLRIHIHNAKNAIILKEYIWLQIGIFIGVIGVMAAYNTALFLFIRDRSYLYYVISLIFLGLYFLALEGVFNYFFSIVGYWDNNRIMNLSIYFFSAGMLQFTRSYFGTSQNFLKWDKTLKIILALLLVFFVIEFIVLSQIQYFFKIGFYVNVLIAVSMLALMGFSVYAHKQKFAAAKYYLIANSLFFVFALYYLAQPQHLGLLPATLLGSLSLKIGVLIQVVVFSLALAARINIFRREIAENKLEKEMLEKQQIIEIQKITEQKKEELEVKVVERTQELKEAIEELHQIVEKLDLTNEALRNANTELARKNMDITDSINYASRIQRAILPLQENIDKIIPQNFIFYKPRDIVAGDFYWLQQINEKIIVAAADCTGHGVPGALMSIISHELLNEIILTKGILQPNIILETLHKSIQKALKQEETQNFDGLDIALIVWDKAQKKLSFAGANNSLILIQNQELREIPADKHSIGGMQYQTKRTFTLQEVELIANLPFMVYLYSDGYQDQFGGANRKKFLKSRFKKLLLEISTLDISEQKNVLEQTLKTWQEDEPQTDDILVIGLKINPQG